MGVLVARQTELGEDRVDVLLDRLAAEHERVGDGSVRLALGHRPEDLGLPRGEPPQLATGVRPHPHQRLDDLRVDHRPSPAHLVDGGQQLVQIADALLEEVGAALGSLREERTHVSGLDVLAEQDHPDARLLAPNVLGGADALVGVRRRHPDVRQHDVRPVRRRGGEQLVVVGGLRHDLYAGLALQQPLEPGAQQVVVVRQDQPDRHGASPSPATSGACSRSSGTRTAIRPPPPGTASTVTVPPSAPMRSCIASRVAGCTVGSGESGPTSRPWSRPPRPRHRRPRARR